MLTQTGFAMSYGVFQEYYSGNWTLEGSREVTGIIGTTLNGVTYLSMPLLFALFTRRWAHWRRTAAFYGALLTATSFLLSSFSTHVWQLVATQGVLAALGTALIFSPTTLSLGEWYNTSNRALAYGVTLSCKNIVGSACPFLMRVLLDQYGFRTTLRIWAAVVTGSSILAILTIPTHPSVLSPEAPRARRIPWRFLRHRTFWIYSIATTLQSCGYGLPQTYLNTYAHEVTLLSQTSATLLLTLFNIPGIASSSFFGYLSDNKRFPLSATTVTAISGIVSGLSAFLLWGLTSPGSMALLVLFSITFGFAAGGYSATWGGALNEMASEAAQRNEAIDTGMVYGLLNGARGIGYVAGGLVGVPLLNAGHTNTVGSFGYGTSYGPIIIFTGLSSVFGGWGLLWKWKKIMRFF
ncbi:major facilitator superfamily domain-containing protein [Truncatella angustata]|uniref:Major facilitator superfamily domain-containing protein n=1 Tax=Truncatella angustata TaxID=152316 RepID=A0A9P8UPL2_9PEZI|nr:major facilitator superfamily domain-containing protein [Truncatella angustata]KAH6655902.1 major facilitator superfamily domain-containing protein [Truncatella angustata]